MHQEEHPEPIGVHLVKFKHISAEKLTSRRKAGRKGFWQTLTPFAFPARHILWSESNLDSSCSRARNANLIEPIVLVKRSLLLMNWL